ncbi:MAG TPA: hypothetical protein VIJ68_04540 [Candidatus Saccharimonadales bacterium]
MMWGTPETQSMGSGPMMVLSLLDHGPERVALITMGTGASKREDGAIEAQVSQDFILEKFEELEAFALIANHAAWPDSKKTIHQLIEQAVLDTKSKNTKYEIGQAAVLFQKHNLSQILEVTNRDHGPRCQVGQSFARKSGVIGPEQRWKLIVDDISYLGGLASGSVVLEQPHRGDDETMGWEPPLWPASFMKAFFDLPRDRRHITAQLMRHIIGEVGTMDEATFEEMQRSARQAPEG